MRTLIFGRMVVHKERINERGSHIFVEWSPANKRNKSVRDLIFGWMVVHKRKNKWKRTIYFCQLVVYKQKKWISGNPKFRRVRGASHHPTFIGNCPTISHTSSRWMSSPSRKSRRRVSPRFPLTVFVSGVNQEN